MPAKIKSWWSSKLQSEQYLVCGDWLWRCYLNILDWNTGVICGDRKV